MANRPGPGVGRQQMSSASSDSKLLNEHHVAKTQIQTVTSSASTAISRKLLPAVPSTAINPLPTPMVIDRSSAHAASGDANFRPFFLEYALISEYSVVAKDRHKLQGIYVIPSSKTPLVWNGVLFVRQGLYEHGVFRFNVHIPANYPDGDCPSVIFNPPVYHPSIDPVTGSLDVVRAFHKWRRTVNNISQILLYASRIFTKIETKDPLNSEAADLYKNNLGLFKDRVSVCIALCRETLYKDPDPSDEHAIRFSQWNPAVHEAAKRDMYSSVANLQLDNSRKLTTPTTTATVS